MYSWNEENETRLLLLREQGLSYSEIAGSLGTTVSSVKHKYIRLKQRDNDDTHHHPTEKIEQLKKCLSYKAGLSILETNAGWGNLTKYYCLYGDVIAHELNKKKVEYLKSHGWPNLEAVKCDSFKQIHKYVFENRKFDVIDLDPYGFPSRYFPHILQLIDEGVLFVTFPKMGVQQINKITQIHYSVFWDITLDDKENYLEKIHSKIQAYGMQDYRVIEVMDVIELQRVYRIAYKVKKESAFKIVGYTK